MVGLLNPTSQESENRGAGNQASDGLVPIRPHGLGLRTALKQPKHLERADYPENRKKQEAFYDHAETA